MPWNPGDCQNSPQLIQAFKDWFKEITLETERIRETSIGIGGKVDASGGIPSILSFSTNLLAQIKGSEKEQEDHPRELTAGLFAPAGAYQRPAAGCLRKKLKEKQPNTKGFLFIFDNLDRVPPQVGEHLFLKYANQLRELHCTRHLHRAKFR